MSKPLKEWVKENVPEIKGEGGRDYYEKGFFRDPIRTMVIDGDHFYSPADGTIIYQKEVDPDEKIIDIKGAPFTLRELMQDNSFNRRCLVIGIFLSQYDVHIARLPYSGILSFKKLESIETKNRPMLGEETEILHGLIDYNDMSYAFTNERYVETIFCPQIKYKYHMVSIADSDVDVISHLVKNGKRAIQNQRIASIRYGSQIDLVLPMPLYYELLQPVGYHVEAGVDKLVRIVSSPGFVRKAWQVKSGKWHDYDKSGKVIEVPPPGDSGGNIKEEEPSGGKGEAGDFFKNYKKPDNPLSDVNKKIRDQGGTLSENFVSATMNDTLPKDVSSSVSSVLDFQNKTGVPVKVSTVAFLNDDDHGWAATNGNILIQFEPIGGDEDNG